MSLSRSAPSLVRPGPVMQAPGAGLVAARHFMRTALELAKLSQPAPNPRVGALVVRAGEVVGWGWHERAGAAHAEVAALARAGELARGATVYVTLEPCNHFGRTPPCVDALLRAGVARVVIGARDPNAHVRGGGAVRLLAAGVEVVEGVLRPESADLIADWVASLSL